MRPKTDEAKRRKIEAMYEGSRRQFPDVPEITVEELKELLDEGDVVLVDVRSEEEQAVSMISGAISSRSFEENIDGYAGSKVVAYCTVGHRSGLYAKDLQSRGWEVFNLRGAILAWTHANGTLVNAEGPTRRVHVYSRQARLSAEGYEPVW